VGLQQAAAVDRSSSVPWMKQPTCWHKYFGTYSSSLGAAKQSLSQRKGNINFAAVWGILQSSYRNLQQAAFQDQQQYSHS
jgi:hypothetical protein